MINWHKLSQDVTFGQIEWYGDHFSRFSIVNQKGGYELSEALVRDTGLKVQTIKRYTAPERFRTISEAKALAQGWVDRLNRAHAAPRETSMFVSDLSTIADRFSKLIRGDFGVDVGEVDADSSYVCESGDYYAVIRMPADRFRIDFMGPDHHVIECGV